MNNKYLYKIISSYIEYDYPFIDELKWTTRLIYIQTEAIYFNINDYIYKESGNKRKKKAKIQYLYDYNSWSLGFR